MATDEILEVERISREDGDYIVRCPHCGRVMGIEGDDISEMGGEQYQDRICGGWMEVSHDAHYVRTL